ncbi:TauD/TfdA family dioxygenase [Neptunomonas antarctica]|uniref:Gamma-butyrobetaine dioxygenase n=1 Tax=Neptunomonas antarctica TaxID=619304 RepID=A0A1N7KYS5_9GAMM|nr:TauD/TfdA family dioxygenase [Neptunomonas antarctica]SIS66701.1 gamma-butyrobetaine dioxygenase [Neptunomonas antarctica]
MKTLQSEPTSDFSAVTDFYIASVAQSDRAIQVRWSDGSNTTYHNIWLRDNCPTAFHPHTGERCFDLLSVSQDIHPLSVTLDTGTLIIEWSEQGHISCFEQSWLREFCYSGELAKDHSSSYQSWSCEFIDHIPVDNQQDILTSDRALYEWMSALDKYGLAIINGMPNEPEAVVQTANRIDYLRQTNFGVTFDVVSEKVPINLAYTSLSLPLHTDLANQEIPPGYQFLHCLSNESMGGESTFVDGLKVLEGLREDQPEYFRLLCEYAIPFRFHDQAHDIREHHPVINLDNFGNIVEIKYNAHLADIFDLPGEVMYDYYIAYRELMGRLKDARYKIELKLSAGEMVVFDNRRVLHGRNAFDDSAGKRHLRGCYVDRSEFKSRLRVLGKQLAKVI